MFFYISLQFEQFVVDVLQDALEFDGFVTSHPIYVPVNNPDEINEIFDTISYSKVQHSIPHFQIFCLFKAYLYF